MSILISLTTAYSQNDSLYVVEDKNIIILKSPARASSLQELEKIKNPVFNPGLVPPPSGTAQIITGSIIAGIGAYIFMIGYALQIDNNSGEYDEMTIIRTVGAGITGVGTAIWGTGLDRRLVRKKWQLNVTPKRQQLSYNLNF